ncbi:hypothetical protein [Pseudomonas sp.]|uniref:hypothetical protein n=1 Tax=Pseudomonas sp. TaxID=306 RepID=UPI0031DE3642
MTDNQEAAIWLFLFTIVISTMLAWLYIGWRYAEYIESFFSESSFVLGNKKMYSSAGLFGKVMRVGSVALMLSMTALYVRRGLVSASEVLAFPVGVKRTLVGLWLVHVLVFGVLIMFYFWVGLCRS